MGLPSLACDLNLQSLRSISRSSLWGHSPALLLIGNLRQAALRSAHTSLCGIAFASLSPRTPRLEPSRRYSQPGFGSCFAKFRRPTRPLVSDRILSPAPSGALPGANLSLYANQRLELEACILGNGQSWGNAKGAPKLEPLRNLGASPTARMPLLLISPLGRSSTQSPWSWLAL